MANQNGIEINARFWLPTGETVDEQIVNLSLVKAARETKDYSALFAKGTLEAIKTDIKTRRVKDEPAAGQGSAHGTEAASEAGSNAGAGASGMKAAFDAVPPAGPIDDEEPAGTVGGAQMEGDDDPAVEIPAFLQKSEATAE
jgi:hypothetical protein